MWSSRDLFVVSLYAVGSTHAKTWRSKPRPPMRYLGERLRMESAGLFCLLLLAQPIQGLVTCLEGRCSDETSGRQPGRYET